MGEAIDFPKNYDIYMIKAVRFLQKGNLKKAESFIKMAYDIKKEKACNFLYASILAEQGDYEQAKEIADECFHLYESSEDKQLFYLMLLLKLQRFHQAESWMNIWGKQKTSTENWKKMEETVESEKKKMKQQDDKNKKVIAKQMSSLAQYSTEHQIQILGEAEKIPVPVFQKLAYAQLVNPFVSNEAKTLILHFLSHQDADRIFPILWFDEMREVNPVKTGTLDKQTSYQEIHSLLSERLEFDPTLEAMISSEIDRHLFKLYPFNDEIIHSPGEWVNYYLESYDPSYSMYGQEEWTNQEMRKWFDKLMKEDRPHQN